MATTSKRTKANTNHNTKHTLQDTNKSYNKLITIRLVGREAYVLR